MVCRCVIMEDGYRDDVLIAVDLLQYLKSLD